MLRISCVVSFEKDVVSLLLLGVLFVCLFDCCLIVLCGQMISLLLVYLLLFARFCLTVFVCSVCLLVLLSF